MYAIIQNKLQNKSRQMITTIATTPMTTRSSGSSMNPTLQSEEWKTVRYSCGCMEDLSTGGVEFCELHSYVYGWRAFE